MWKVVGITILLSRTVTANLNDENAYYLADTNEDRSLEEFDNSRETTSDVGASEATKLRKDESYQRQWQQPENRSFRDYSRLESQPKRSTVHVQLRDGTSEHEQAPLATLLYWPDREDQVIGMENRRNRLTQELRYPSFSPWGGKRDLERYKTITKIRRPVRVPFNSWGGKRNDERIHFPLAFLKRNNFVNWEDNKSPPFNSWGGKRASIEFHPMYKVSAKQQPCDSENRRESEQRAKMDSDFGTFISLKNSERIKHAAKLTDNETEVKRGSLKLIGSGEMTTSGSTMRDNFPRVPFEPWGGKRRGELSFDNDDPSRSASVALVFRKIGRSIPWTE